MTKAWRVDSECGEKSCIVFHNHGLAARRIGGNQLDRDFYEVTCQREAKFDKYAANGYVPPLVLLEDGWWFECKKCFKQVSFDDLYNVKKEDVTEAGRQSVYCSSKCREDTTHEP